jgi:hypothetical protein
VAVEGNDDSNSIKKIKRDGCVLFVMVNV